MSLGREARGAVPRVGCGRRPGADPLRVCCVQGYPQMMPQVNSTRQVEARRPRPPGMQAHTAVLCNPRRGKALCTLTCPPAVVHFCSALLSFAFLPPAHRTSIRTRTRTRRGCCCGCGRSFDSLRAPRTRRPTARGHVRFCAGLDSLSPTFTLLQMLAQGGYPQPGAMPPGYPPYPYPMMGAYPQPVAGGKGKAAAGEPATKGRKRRKRIPQGGPKKPATSFVLFSNTVREQVKQDNQGLSFLDLGRKLGEMWREMDPNVGFPFPLARCLLAAASPVRRLCVFLPHLKKHCPAPHVPFPLHNLSIQVADLCLKC